MKVTRRRFLSRAAAIGSAAMALPYVVPSGVLAQEGGPGPNERIGVAGIGTGRQGGGLINGFKRYGDAKLLAIADADLARAKAVAGKFGGDAYQDYRKVLERKDVDAIITATPDHWRALVTIHACQAGKDVYAEKPMSLTIREGRLMVEAVRKYKRVFQTGSQQRSMESNHKGCQLIRNGAIGKIKKVIAGNYPSPWEYALPAQEIPSTLNWDLWCGPVDPVNYHAELKKPRGNPGWISFRLFSGGEMTGWGSHGFDQIQWALGMDDSGPVEVWTEGPALKAPKYTEPTPRGPGEKACKSPKVFFKYPGDIIMEMSNGPAGGGLFIGEKGTIRIDRGSCRSDPVEIARTRLKDPKVPLYRSENHYQNWLDCIKSREKCVADVEIGHRSASVCHLGNIARWTGRKLTWDPAKETFTGDREANAYLDRERRKGYRLPEKI
jgi:predicted dehydrogenase